MPGYEQLALFDVPSPVKLTHDWMLHPFGPSECSSCMLLWFSGASREQIVEFLTEDCPVKLLDAEQGPVQIVYLTS